MNNKKYINILAFSISILMLTLKCNIVCGQITIGSDLKPNLGAILDLKEYEIEEEKSNSTKGLLLPRVKLVAINSLEDIASETSEDHTGLMLYNVNPCFSKGAGVYMWDGEEWSRTNLDNPEIGELVDIDGNSYKTMRFGNAGVWMIENLRVTRFATPHEEGKPQPVNEHLDYNVSDPGGSQGLKNLNAAYFYPAPDGTDGKDDRYLDSQQNLGLYYNWPAASKYKLKLNEELPEKGEQNDPSQQIVQGICPNGWHLPSDYEWNRLEEEIANNPEKYSNYGKDILSWYGWEEQWATDDVRTSQISNTPRPNVINDALAHGNAMKTDCSEVYGLTSSENIYGKSYNTFDGGFNVILTGSYNGETHKTINYGNAARFWTSSFSSVSGYSMVSRVFKAANAGVFRSQQDPHWAWSVRCIKNN